MMLTTIDLLADLRFKRAVVTKQSPDGPRRTWRGKSP